MGAKRTQYDATLPGGPTTVGASQTAIPVSRVFGITSNGRELVVSARVTATTQTSTSMVLKLQHSTVNDSTGAPIWTDVTSASVTPSTAAGDQAVDIRVGDWNTAQQSSLPLGSLGRVVVTSGASDTVTVAQVVVLQAAH